MSSERDDGQSRRAGFFKFPRARFDNIRTKYGAIGEQIMIELVSAARFRQTEWQVNSGRTLLLTRGMAVYSSRTFAKRLDRPQRTVHRVFKRLVGGGLIEIVQPVARGVARKAAYEPTVVNISRFEDYNFAEAEARAAFGTQPDYEERRNIEESSSSGVGAHGARLLAEDRSGREAMGDARYVLDHYETVVVASRNRAVAIATISDRISEGMTPDALARAADAYGSTRPPHGHVLPPEHFYWKNFVTKYMPDARNSDANAVGANALSCSGTASFGE